MKKSCFLFTASFATAFVLSCNDATTPSSTKTNSDTTKSYVEKQLAGYATVKLTTNLSQLTEKEKQMIPLLIEAAKIMDTLYWNQSYS